MTLLWLLGCAGLAAACLLRPSPALLCAGGLWLLAPLAAWLLLLLGRKRLRQEIVCAATAEKQKPVSLTLSLRRPRWLPAGAVRFRIETENTVTGERQCFSLSGTPARATLESRYCGCIRLRVTRVTVREAFGLLPVVLRGAVQRQLCILPETFPVQLEPVLSLTQQDCSEYDPNRRGTDRTETLQIRDYVPGDSLRQIHWKLSGKAGRLIVRDPARPVDHSLRIFVARQTAQPALADALLEAAVSVCQALENQPFCLMWNEDTLCSREVFGTESLLEALTDLMKAPARETLPPWDAPQCGTLLYFGFQMPEAPPENALLFLCCENAQDAAGVIAFTPDHMKEKLENLTGSLSLL